jgi:branched-chain amino acid transport system substrate-binding protein
MMVGPNASVAAVPPGEVANERETPMISPWSTNPSTTLGRPWVFRVPYIDVFQGPILAAFAAEEFEAERACVLFASDSDARAAWPIKCMVIATVEGGAPTFHKSVCP